AVVAGRAVGLGGFRARARRRVTGARVVALVPGRAHDGCPGHAAAALTRVADRAGVTVRARAAVDLRRVRARAGRRVARARVVALVLCGADDGRSGHAAAALAHVADGTRVIVAARTAAGFGRIGTHAGRRVACARVVALVLRDARDGRPRGAVSGLAHVADRARVAVVARRPVDPLRSGADARHRVARARDVALVEGP